MVTGPFPDAASANEMVRSLKAKGVDTFRFQSAEGEKVRPLG
jgi:hypothetical protein